MGSDEPRADGRRADGPRLGRQSADSRASGTGPAFGSAGSVPQGGWTERVPRGRASGFRRWGGLVAFGLSLVACGGSQAPARETPPATATETHEAEAPAPSTPDADAAAQSLVDAALRRMAALRGLPVLGPVEARHLSAEELVREVELTLDKHVPPAAVAGTADMLFGLGTVPANFDYRASLLALMGTDLAGLYDPERRLMLLRGDLDGTALAATLDHELVHALQDQHYDLGRVLEWREDATDAQSGLSALAEGDATSAMLDAMLQSSGKLAYELPTELLETEMRVMAGSSHESSSVPGVLKRSLMSPYVDGLRFVHAVRREEGWAGVDRVWKRPPATTEQLLHLDKYRAAEPPLEVPFPEPPPVSGTAQGVTAQTGAQGGAQGASAAPVWQVEARDIWGEQSLRLVFEEWMPTRSAAKNAEGWGGDRIVVFGMGARRAVVWRLEADDAASARRMHIAFLRGVFGPGWSADPRAVADVSEADAIERARKGELCRERSEAGPFHAERRGTTVIVIAGIFERAPEGPRAAGTCADARAWAERLFRQPHAK